EHEARCRTREHQVGRALGDAFVVAAKGEHEVRRRNRHVDGTICPDGGGMPPLLSGQGMLRHGDSLCMLHWPLRLWWPLATVAPLVVPGPFPLLFATGFAFALAAGATFVFAARAALGLAAGGGASAAATRFTAGWTLTLIRLANGAPSPFRPSSPGERAISE